MPLILEFFSPAVRALNQEVLHHPDLQLVLQNQPVNQLEERLAAVAHFCNVAVDGYFYKEDIDDLAHLLFKKLQERRTGIITLN